MDNTTVHPFEERLYTLFETGVKTLYMLVFLRYFISNTSEKLHEIQNSIVEFFLILIKFLTHPWVYNFIWFSLALSLPIYLGILISMKRKDRIKKVVFLLFETVAIHLIVNYFSKLIPYHF